MQTETTTDVEGGGLNIGFIEDGDYVSYKPVNLKDITRAALPRRLGGPGGTIEVRTGLADRPARGHDGADHADRRLADLQGRSSCRSRRPAGTHELFLVFRNPGATASLLNVNWIEFVGKGAAQTAAPEVDRRPRPRLTGARAADGRLRHDRDRPRRPAR